MIKDVKELNIEVKKARLLTCEEVIKYEEQIPERSYTFCNVKWWLADTDENGNIACAYDSSFIADDPDAYVNPQEYGIYLRVGLEISGDIEDGQEFIYHDVVFIALSRNLAISASYLGIVRYFDIGYIEMGKKQNNQLLKEGYIDENVWKENDDRLKLVKCTINNHIDDLFNIEGDDETIIDDIIEFAEDDCDEFDSEYEDEDEMDESDEDDESAISCKKCHYYDMCDEKDEETRYCPSYREKK